MRIVIAEDCPVYRRGLAEYLADFGASVVAEAESASEILALMRLHVPDIVILDIAMPPTRDAGLVVAEHLRVEFPGIGILILSEHAETDYALRLLDPDPRGKGYWIKNHVADDLDILKDALDRIAAGGCAIDPEIIRRLTNSKRDHPGRNIIGGLTARELEVLRLVGEGHKNRGIAARLNISHKTVDNHVNKIFEKFELGADISYDRRVLLVLKYLEAIPEMGSTGTGE